MIHAVSDQRHVTLPGDLWPAGCDRGASNPVYFGKINTKREINALLDHFGTHPLGRYNRSFGFQAWGLALDGQAAALAVSASVPGNTSAGYRKRQVVDLARIARHPAHPGILRVMLRLWRDYLATQWDYWDDPVQAAVSYALPGKAGNLYRFDGWKFYGYCKPWSSSGSGWSNPSRANGMADGIKRLYYYDYTKAA